MRYNRVGRWAVLGSLLAATPVWGAPPPAKPFEPGAALAVVGGGKTSPAALAGSLRAFVVSSLPNPLFEDARHWNKQKRSGPRKKLRNEGRWWKVRMIAQNPANTLVLDLRDMKKPQRGRTTFTVFVAFDANVELERQTWRRGLRLYSASTRARLRVKLTLRCEAVTRVLPGGGVLPEAVFRLRVLTSDLRYDNFVVEHTAGVGGDAARVLGEIIHGGLHRFRPSLERDLLARANAAIVKAGDTKDVRLSLTSFFGGK